jgi:hypothetical protein
MIDPLVIPIVAILAVFATLSIGVVAHYVYLIQRLKAENALKEDMLMRGYSAEEIACVIGAPYGTRTSCGEHRHKAPDAKKAAQFAA